MSEPAQEPRDAAASETTIRFVAVLALLWGAAYLVWRIGWTWRGANIVLYLALLAAELVGWVSLGFYAFLAWRRASCTPVAPTVLRHVDVLVPTYDEPVAVLHATLLGCAAVRHPHTTWLLDDGRRPEMEQLARRMGVRYLTREDNSHAKAGNINHALGHLEGELVAVLDADHVPLPDFLDALVGHFDDPGVALVQAPHEFSNLDSVQHVAGQVHEQSLFFRVICPGKERDGATFWCGSGTVLRRSALTGIGGVQTATIAEDFHTSIVLHSRGWRTHYVDETLLLGLAPHDLDSFLLQRSRWARGNLRVLWTRQNPLVAHGLTWRQRLSYLGSLSHYFGGPQRLVMLVVLCATLLSGLLPLYGEPILFAVLWAPWVALSLLCTKLLGRGHVGPATATRFGWMTMGIYSRAVLGLFLPAVGGFRVTPKVGVDEAGIGVIRRLPLLAVGGAVLLSALVARAFAALGLAELGEMPLFALLATLAIGTFELAVISAVLVSLARHRQMRSSYRVQVDLAARVGDRVARVTDLTVGGAGLLLQERRAVGSMFDLELRVPDLDGVRHDLDLRAVVRSSTRTEEGTTRLGVEFVRPSEAALERLIEYSKVTLPSRRHRPWRPADPVPDEPGGTPLPRALPDPGGPGEARDAQVLAAPQGGGARPRGRCAARRTGGSHSARTPPPAPPGPRRPDRGCWWPRRAAAPQRPRAGPAPPAGAGASPPLRNPPSGPTLESSPSGRASNQSSAPTERDLEHRGVVGAGRPSARLSLTVVSKRWSCWRTTATSSASSAGSSRETSRPCTSTRPARGASKPQSNGDRGLARTARASEQGDRAHPDAQTDTGQHQVPDPVGVLAPRRVVGGGGSS
ncbi:MAG: glycosyltransferase family 2 protein [Microthrixaceae bacterium]